MKKLNLEHLKVDSFEPLPAEESGRGTVHGREHTCPEEYTCDFSCPDTCEETCGTCWFTCLADCTADASCLKTCYGRTCYA